jgi:transcriptional regulator with XRE-family HTH domain
MNSPCRLRANFAIVLKRWRIKHRISQKQMAADLGFRISTVSAWETGARFPNGYTLEHISVYTGLSPCRLFCDRAVRCLPGRCALALGRA